jgi:hypothetical protein
LRRALPVEERFWSKVIIIELDECWVWQGTINKGGYGKINISGKSILAHRYSYNVAHPENPLGPGEFACHSCDNRPCVNPKHIWKGNHTDNMRDMFKKGRKKNFNKGETVPQHVLTVKQVEEIRELYAKGVKNQTELAAIYGCSQPNIGMIVRGKWWKDYPGPNDTRRKRSQGERF